MCFSRGHPQVDLVLDLPSHVDHAPLADLDSLISSSQCLAAGPCTPFLFQAYPALAPPTPCICARPPRSGPPLSLETFPASTVNLLLDCRAFAPPTPCRCPCPPRPGPLLSSQTSPCFYCQCPPGIKYINTYSS